MVTTHNLGFPRIGAARELKFALESYWDGSTGENDLSQLAAGLRQEHWQRQTGLDWLPVGDFSLYDQVLDMSFTLGHLPARFAKTEGSSLDRYFRVARGRSAQDTDCQCGAAGELTKWFDTNYHYIVPEFDAHTSFTIDPSRLRQQLAEANARDIKAKPVIIGPITYLWLGKSIDGSNRLDLLPKLLPAYAALLDDMAAQGASWVQIDEPVLVTALDAAWRHAFHLAYHQLQHSNTRLLLATYFGRLQDNLQLACELPVAGLHLDASSAPDEVDRLIDWLPSHKILSLGVVNGRNIWKTDLNSLLERLEPIHARLQDRLWLAPSCSLLHVPVDLDREDKFDPEIKQWMAFATQKLDEIQLLARALNRGRDTVAGQLAENAQAIASRTASPRVNNPAVKSAVAKLAKTAGQRHGDYETRARKQASRLTLPMFPTTTIGSFPQTTTIRQARRHLRQGKIDQADYRSIMRAEISRVIREQASLGLDVMVHGEAERNDMVEYFGEQLDGYTFSQYGWVQSYGSRCVKPPILFGDVGRRHPMTLEWTAYAQSLTDKPVKGMLTGPVTMLNWSFVRDDQPRAETCRQLALAIREEVLDLERIGTKIIQIDEAALREGLPLRKTQWKGYLAWAIESFRIAANGVSDETQIHTHMCYSEFNDIIESIAAMDADVITIETSRSDMALLDAFKEFAYPNQIGPGVYDIHSPNIPTQEQIIHLMQKAAKYLPADRLWINPDCGLKTRRWEEVLPALGNMVEAAKRLRQLTGTNASTVST